MSRRAAGAALCAAAAIALVVAAFAPWWRIVDRGEEAGVRANFTLLGGELCRTDGYIECKDLAYTGRVGLRDELFAWTGRLTLAVLLVTAALAVVLAFAGGGRRALLRGVTATAAAIGAGLAAAVVAVEQLPLSGDTELSFGLWAALAGSIAAAVGAAWPLGAVGPLPPARRWGLGLGIAAVALIAWITIGLRAWWAGTGTFASHGMSPLGLELCDRDLCTQLGVGPRGLATLAALVSTAALAAATLVVAAGLAVRAARGVAPRGWAIATAVVGGLAVVDGVLALVLTPRRGMELGPGAWGFLIAGAGLVALAIAGQRMLAWIDPADADHDGPVVLPFGALPASPKPVLPALGPSANPPATPATAAAPARPSAPATSAAAPIARRTAPPCPTCRASTLWHGKREAWWCSTCKQTV